MPLTQITEIYSVIADPLIAIEESSPLQIDENALRKVAINARHCMEGDRTLPYKSLENW